MVLAYTPSLRPWWAGAHSLTRAERAASPGPGWRTFRQRVISGRLSRLAPSPRDTDRGIAPVTAWAESLPLPASLGGAALVITDSSRRTHTAPLFYVSPSQVNFLVPAGVTAGPATIAVYRGDVQVLVGDAQIEAVAPALFSAAANGQGVAAAYAVNIAEDGATTAQAVFSCAPDAGPCTYEPINAGLGVRSVLTLFGTGIRHAPDSTSVSVTIGGEEARVLYAGPQFQFAGLDQVNVEVPSQLTGRGEAEVVLTVASKPSNKVTIFFQ